MRISTAVILGCLLSFIILVPGPILLQIYLSKKENKWLGFILPCTTFVMSIIVVLGITFFSVNTVSIYPLEENGAIIAAGVEQLASPSGMVLSILLTSLYTFILCNTPTGILFLIYKCCRNGSIKKREMEKMSIQDLE